MLVAHWVHATVWRHIHIIVALTRTVVQRFVGIFGSASLYTAAPKVYQFRGPNLRRLVWLGRLLRSTLPINTNAQLHICALPIFPNTAEARFHKSGENAKLTKEEYIPIRTLTPLFLMEVNVLDDYNFG